MYKKILATNNPKFEGIKQGWTKASRADESTNCSENVLKQLLINTENLLNNTEVKETKNSQETDESKEKDEMKEFWKNVKVTTNIKAVLLVPKLNLRKINVMKLALKKVLKNMVIVS